MQVESTMTYLGKNEETIPVEQKPELKRYQTETGKKLFQKHTITSLDDKLQCFHFILQAFLGPWTVCEPGKFCDEINILERFLNDFAFNIKLF